MSKELIDLDELTRQNEDLPGEEWKQHPIYTCYEISNLGRVKSIRREYFCNGQMRYTEERIMKIAHRYRTNKNGRKVKDYCRVLLRKNGKSHQCLVHRLVGDCFGNNPDNLPEWNHLNADPWDNRAVNLAPCTRQQNIDYIKKENRNPNPSRKKWTKARKKKLQQAIINSQGRKVKCGNKVYPAVSVAAEKMNIPYSTLTKWLRGTTKMPDKYQKLGLAYVD